MPLVLQHAGHSRTIIGYEITTGGAVNLLLFDPARRPNTELREAALGLAQPVQHPHRAALKSVSHHMSPSRLLHKLHRKRQVIDVDAEEAPPKRPRSGSPTPAPADDEVICLDVPPIAISQFRPPPGSKTVEVNLNPSKVINFFRLSLKQLGYVFHPVCPSRQQLTSYRKKSKYQILYFPLSEPLTEQERSSLRIVRSEKVN
jgi:hypothetical protein